MTINEQPNYFVEGLHKNIDFKEQKYFGVPKYIFDKWQLYKEVESCVNHNLKDDSLPNKIFVLKCLSTIYFDYKKNEELMYQEKNVEIIEVCNFLIRKIDKKIDELQLTLDIEIKNIIEPNYMDYFASKFDLHFEPYKSCFKGKSYDNLKFYLGEFYKTNNLPIKIETIEIDVSNKKNFGWAFNLLNKDLRGNKVGLSFEYLKFIKEYISVYQDFDFSNVNYRDTKLYKYLTTKPVTK